MRTRVWIVLAAVTVGGFVVAARVRDGSARAASAEQGAQGLAQEIAALEAKRAALRGGFDAEQHDWEAAVLQQASAKSGPGEPDRIMAILALEPSEREPSQREELAAYFEPRSKCLGGIHAELQRKRAALRVLSGNR